MSRVHQGNVKVLSEPRQTSVKLSNIWTYIGQACPEIVQTLSNQIEKEQFFSLDKHWTDFGLLILKLRVNILGFGKRNCEIGQMLDKSWMRTDTGQSLD